MLARATRLFDWALWAGLIVCGLLAIVAYGFAGPPLKQQLIDVLSDVAVPVTAALAIVEGVLWALGRYLRRASS